MAAVERRRVIRARYDGHCFIPEEPVDLAPDTEVEVTEVDHGPTWAELHLGLPRLAARGPGPSTAEIIHEQRGPY